MTNFAAVAATTFGLLFLAELPDKTMFASLAMGTRMRPLHVWLGVSAAFAVHVGLAVSAGSVLGLLPAAAVYLASAALFAFGAVVLLRGGGGDEDVQDGTAAPRMTGFWPVFSTAFGTVFVSEWGDLSQITIANLAAAHGPGPVAVGALAALTSVAALALLAGRTIATRVPLRAVRRIGAGAMVVLAAWSLAQAFGA